MGRDLYHASCLYCPVRDAPSVLRPPGRGGFILQGFLTFFVALPTLLTVFSMPREPGNSRARPRRRGLLGWIGALPWEEPMVLAVAFSLVMLDLGEFGGFIERL